MPHTITVRITLDAKLAMRNGNRLRYNLVLPVNCTFNHVMIKMRRILKEIRPEEGLYFFVDGAMPAISKTLGSYNQAEIKALLLVENSFG